MRYCYNHGIVKTKGVTVAAVKPSASAKPAAKSGIDFFADAAKNQVVEKARSLLPAEEANIRGKNLGYWWQARGQLYDELSAEEKNNYENAAEEYNEKLKLGPPPDHIYE